MGVKGAKNKKQQEKWNKFVSLLVKNAGLPSTCLVRLTFKNSEGKTHEINNFADLKQLSKDYGTKTEGNYLQMSIFVEVLALTFTDYQKRFKYEQDKYMQTHNIKPQKNNLLSEKHKTLLSKFVLPSLTTTNAVIQKQIQIKQKPAQNSQSPSINFMDMLNVNQKQEKKESKSETDPVINDLMQNVVNSPKSEPPKQSPIIKPEKPRPQPPKPIPTSVVADKSKKQTTLSTIYGGLPLVSFEELRFKHYIDNGQWKIIPNNATKLTILNWPNAMNKDTLKTIFSPYGPIIDCSVSEESAMIQYSDNNGCDKAIAALDGFQIGINKLSVQLYVEKVDEDSESEKDMKEEPQMQMIEEEKEDKKLVVGNWPCAMGVTLLQTLFKGYGELREAKIVNECGLVEYATKEEAQKAYKALNGFQMGNNKLALSFATNEISHILSMDNDGTENDNESGNEIAAENEYEYVGNPIDDANEISPEIENNPNDIEIVPETDEIHSEEGSENEVNHQKSIFEEMDNENGNENEQAKVEIIESEKTEMKVDTALINRLNIATIAENTEIDMQTPNEIDIEAMVQKEDQNSENKSEKSENKPEKRHKHKHHKREVSDSESETESSSSESDSSTDYSTDSSFEAKLQKKALTKKLSKKDIRKLKQKHKRRKKRRLRKRKTAKKLRNRERDVDKSISALNECLDKFTNLMTSVSQSAMVMQQSVAQISQIHTQQQQQSIVYQQSMKTLFPNQPMYTSLVTQTAPGTNANTQTQTDNSTGNNTQSIQNIITELSQTKGGNGSPMNMASSPMNNSAALQQQILMNQQLLHQQQMMLNNNNAKVGNWVQNNYPKPVLGRDIASSPILHSTSVVRGSESNNGNVMSVLSDGPGNNSNDNQSKSKIFEHKQALKNISKEMDEKLNKLHEMGYKNRTFNLVLLKQEKGDMDKVIANLKQFYQNN